MNSQQCANQTRVSRMTYDLKTSLRSYFISETTEPERITKYANLTSEILQKGAPKGQKKDAEKQCYT